MGKIWAVDAIALNFSTELDSTDWRDYIFKVRLCMQFEFLVFGKIIKWVLQKVRPYLS